MRFKAHCLLVVALAALLTACGEGGDEGGSINLPNTVPASVTSSNYVVLAWNDLGMHCVDGKDYSVFSILPPYNNLRAQVVQRNAGGTPGLVSSGITLSYEAVADATGSINTRSADKTNFWSWAQSLFGLASAPADNVGLTGNPTPSATPAAMTYNASFGGWEASGIPVTPYPDNYTTTQVKEFYPMVKVVARDANGAVLASTKVVLPVSDEMSCKTCHASNSEIGAQPLAGWVNNTDEEKDWKLNILRLHDESNPTAITNAGMSATYTHGTLYASALAGQPVLCAGCHQSNALGTALKAGIKPLTEAMHRQHAWVNNPATGAALENDTTRTACYLCHPGSVTKCLRGVMGNAVDAQGNPSIDCQSCHGPMSSVAASTRQGWLDEPTCQGCHDRADAAAVSFSRFTSVFSSGTTVRTQVDSRFATNAGQLYRQSSGHGGLQCEACHGATHAEYPSSHANDNVQSQDAQGHTGTVAQCTVCHATMPSTTSGGPHGMHSIGSTWVSGHRRVGWSTACAACHGADTRGTAMSKVFATGQVVGCYTCHKGPSGD